MKFSIIIFFFSIQYCLQLLRVQSPEGTKRIEIPPTATLRELYEEIHDAFQLDGYNFAVYGERNFKKELASSRTKTIDDSNLKHGDMIFMKAATAGPSTPVILNKTNLLFTVFTH